MDDRLGLKGAITTSLYGYLKRHPRIRRASEKAYRSARRTMLRQVGIRSLSSAPTPVPDTATWVANWNSTGAPPAEVTIVRPAELVNNPPPLGQRREVEPEFELASTLNVPPAFVARIPKGRAVGEHGAIVTPDNKLLMDVSRPVGSLRDWLLGLGNQSGREPEFLRDAALPARQRHETVAVLSAYYGRGYFHWLWDVLPRLGLLRDFGIHLSEVDKFLIPAYLAPFQIETLATLGIHRSRVITSINHRHIEAAELIVPSLPRENGVVPTWAVDYLRAAFPPLKPKSAHSPARIYLTRKVTDHGLIENEQALVGRLKQVGFEPIAFEDFTLREKAWLLAGADAVIGPSGAGLTNIAFCNPGAVIIELRVQPFPILDAWNIANRCKLRFFDVTAVSHHGQVSDLVRSSKVAVDDVFAILESAGILSV